MTQCISACRAKGSSGKVGLNRVSPAASASDICEHLITTNTRLSITEKRKKRFIPPIPWHIAASVYASVSSPRTAGLYFAVYMEMRRLKAEWVRIPDFMLADLGLQAASSRSRAIKDMEALGLLRVERRPGYAPRLTINSQRKI
jgi:hypothetical protein